MSKQPDSSAPEAALRTDDLHIQHVDELRAHTARLRDPAQRDQMLRMLRDMGVGTSFFAERLQEDPTLMMFEQDGLWPLAYRVRGDLVTTLANDAELPFDAATSGTYVLTIDGMAKCGPKAVFNQLHAFPQGIEQRPIPMIPRSMFERHRLEAHGSTELKIENGSEIQQRLIAVIAFMRSMYADFGRAASDAEILRALRGMTSRAKRQNDVHINDVIAPQPILNGQGDAFVSRLRGGAGTDVFASTEQELGAMEADVRTGIHSWSSFWRTAMERQFDRSLRPVDPLFNRFVLEIEDPHQIVRWQNERQQRDPKEPLPIIGFIDDTTGKYVSVFVSGDAESRSMWYKVNGETRPIDWDSVRRLAMEGRTGGPTFTVEYLLLAAANRYMMFDHNDAVHHNGQGDALIHRAFGEYTGQKFPWIHCPNVDETGATAGYTFVDRFNEARTRRLSASAKKAFGIIDKKD